MPTASTGVPMVSSVNFYTEETNPSTVIGARSQTQDGRLFRYVLAGATTLVVGTLQQSVAEDTTYKDMAVQAAAAIGATVIPVTLGATATTLNQLVGGMLVVSVTPGIGQFSRIVAHDVAAGAATCNFTIDDPLVTALTTSSKVTTYPSVFSKVVQAPTTQTGIPVGVAVKAVTNAKYGWLQTHATGACLGDATASAAAAMAVSQSVTTAGAVTKRVTLTPQVGWSIPVATVSARVEPLWLTID